MYPTLEQKEQVVQALKGPQFDRERHGSLFDRGSADSYYGRYAQHIGSLKEQVKVKKLPNLTKPRLMNILVGTSGMNCTVTRKVGTKEQIWNTVKNQRRSWV
jgi:hypothetical protein